MARRNIRRIIGIGIVGAVLSVSLILFSDARGSVGMLIAGIPVSLPLNIAIAATLAGATGFCLVVESLLPAGPTVIDVAHDALRLARHHLVARGRDDGYWHLRILLSLLCIAVVDLLADMLTAVHTG